MLSIETYKWCSTNEFYQELVNGSNGNVYTVIYGETPSDSLYKYDWSCTCPQYKFRGGECKHIKNAKENRCAYGSGAASGSPEKIEGDTCPSCGGEVSVIRVGV